MRVRFSQFMFILLFTPLCNPLNATEVEPDQPIEYLAKNQSSPKASIEDVSWIAGYWQGQIWGGQFEEIWSVPSAGSMMAAFKFIQDGKVKFYEIMSIAEHQGSLVLRLKHFGPQLKGWEEKDKSVDFNLVRLSKDAVYFEGYTYKKISPNELHLYVMIDDNDEKQATKFVFTRIVD